MQDGHTRGWHTGHALLTKRWLVRYIISVAAALSKTRNFLGLTVKTDFQLTPRQKRGHQRPRTFFTVSVHSTVEAKNNRKIVRNKFKPQRLNRAGTFVWILLITWISSGTTIRNLLRNHYSKSFKNVAFSILEAFFECLKSNFFGQKNYLSCPFDFVLHHWNKIFDFDASSFPDFHIFSYLSAHCVGALIL